MIRIKFVLKHKFVIFISFREILNLSSAHASRANALTTAKYSNHITLEFRLDGTKINGENNT